MLLNEKMKLISKALTNLKMSISCSTVSRAAGYLSWVLYQRSNLMCIKNNCRYFCQSKHLLAEEQYTIELLPELEKLLEKGDVKHRKHFGVQKVAPIALPEILINATSRLIEKTDEKFLMSEAKDLQRLLIHRRLPMEKEEINERVKKMYPAFDGKFEDISEIFEKGELAKIRKRIQSDLNRWKPIEYNAQQCLVYLVGRLVPNYASTFKVFSEIKRRVSTFEPKTFLDFGSGVGSAVWAAHAIWGNSIKEYFCVDASSDMNDTAQQLLTDSKADDMIIKTVYHRQFLPCSETVKYDLIVSAFSLMELPSVKDRLQTIDTLWRKTKDILVIIEYGNNAGFQTVVDARDYILQVENVIFDSLGYSPSNAYVVAPCPHDSPCPRLSNSSFRPCGFYVPYQPLFPIGAMHPVKKDWISYVVLRKGHRPETDTSWPRIVKPLLKRDKHVFCGLCCSDGKLRDIVVTRCRHGRHAYRCVRSSTLGDLLPVKLKPLPITETETEDSSHVDDLEMDIQSNKE